MKIEASNCKFCVVKRSTEGNREVGNEIQKQQSMPIGTNRNRAVAIAFEECLFQYRSAHTRGGVTNRGV